MSLRCSAGATSGHDTDVTGPFLCVLASEFLSGFFSTESNCSE
jgi:hypothetical protein